MTPISAQPLMLDVAEHGGSHAEFIAGLLDHMTAGTEPIDWWERATPRPRQ